MDDRELFLLLCRGLLDGCSRVEFAGTRFGLAAKELPTGSSGPVIELDVDEDDFLRMVALEDTWASSLWPERPPRHRAVQLMLVHADEALATTRDRAPKYLLTFAGDDVTVRGSGGE